MAGQGESRKWQISEKKNQPNPKKPFPLRPLLKALKSMGETERILTEY